MTRTRPAPAASKSRVAYEWIRERITSGAFGPGYRLVLTTLAGRLGMSVVPVREAISHLTAEGLVTFEPNVGASVSMADPDRYIHAVEVITVLESAATALSTPHLTRPDMAQARKLNAAMRTALGQFDFRRFTALNQEFHHTLYSRCPNPRLLELVDGEWSRLGHMRDSIFGLVPHRPKESVCEHDELLDLIEGDGTPDRIEQAVRLHRTRSLDAFRTHQPDGAHSPHHDGRAGQGA
ncbi:GntR family transcriptional regulator [Streptomyces sp. ATexAB-D23]|uniref:GntR family transcriptional regulator n=1 Tax=unclassified Streptomyces TaxID=2593676 RepID=UPI0003A1D28D|nr:GntR family transcriptional regulator [Streptomyces sp. ATexAB-D23]